MTLLPNDWRSNQDQKPSVVCEFCGEAGALLLRRGQFQCRNERTCSLRVDMVGRRRRA